MSKKTADNNVKEESFLTDKQTEIQSLQCEIDNYYDGEIFFGEELDEILIWQAEKNGMTVEELLEEYSEFFWKVSATDGEGFKSPIVSSVLGEFFHIKGLEVEIQKLEGGVK